MAEAGLEEQTAGSKSKSHRSLSLQSEDQQADELCVETGAGDGAKFKTLRHAGSLSDWQGCPTQLPAQCGPVRCQGHFLRSRRTLLTPSIMAPSQACTSPLLARRLSGLASQTHA